MLVLQRYDGCQSFGKMQPIDQLRYMLIISFFNAEPKLYCLKHEFRVNGVIKKNILVTAESYGHQCAGGNH